MDSNNVEPRRWVVPVGTVLAHVYYTSSGRPLAWNECRIFGPLALRWEPHQPSADGGPCEQARGVYYAAPNAVTALAETFQATRRIDRVYQSPWLVIFTTAGELTLLDLSETGRDLGAAAARNTARRLYEDHPDAQGIRYLSTVHSGSTAFALNERALTAPLFPRHPDLHRALADDVLLDPLKHAARELGFALR